MRICPKIGPYYITRNNPRELLLQNKELKDKIIEQKNKIYALEHPAEQLLRIYKFLDDYDKLVEERDTYKAKLNMVKDLVMNSDKYDDGDFEGCVFQNDILDIIRGDANDR